MSSTRRRWIFTMRNSPSRRSPSWTSSMRRRNLRQRRSTRRSNGPITNCGTIRDAARMGTAMMGPDYTQWHGFFEVAKTFYTEFIPEAEQLLPGVTTDVMKSDYHKWTEGLSKEQLQQQIDFYKERYKQ